MYVQIIFFVANRKYNNNYRLHKFMWTVFWKSKNIPNNIDELEENNNLDIIKLIKCWLDNYFDKKNPQINNLPLKLNGSKFNQEVWKILKTIPYGQTTTYGEIAKKVALKLNKEKMSARAVGNAVAHNPISIIIPCHRVLGKNNKITGYAGGIDKKIKLLQLENIKFKE